MIRLYECDSLKQNRYENMSKPALSALGPGWIPVSLIFLLVTT